MSKPERERERESYRERKKYESSKGRDTESLKYGTTLVYFGERERKEKEKERVLGASGPRHVSSTASFDD